MTGFTTPKLDDRSYEDLRRELIRRIPVHSTEWTDHNTSDPGITLLELFAWMGENLLYRMNRVPEKSQREYLRLLNIELRQAGVAETLLSFALPKDGMASIRVEADPTQPRTLVAAGDVEFQVEDELWVLPVEALPYVKQSVDLRELETEVAGMRGGITDVEQLLEAHLGDPPGTVSGYETVALPAVEGGALPEPTDLGLAMDRSLWIGLVGPEASFKGKSDAEAATTRATLRADLARKTVTLGVRVDDELCGPTDHLRCPDPGADEARYPLVWQIATGAFDGDVSVQNARYERLEVVEDTTAGLTRSGTVRLRLPAEESLGNWTADSFEIDTSDGKNTGMGEDLLGVGDLPPRLDDSELSARVITWIRCFRPESSGEDDVVVPDPVVRWVGVNVVAARQAVTAATEALGYGSGRASQVVQLSKTPVLPDSLELQVRENGRYVRWHRVEDLALSRANDPHYELEPSTGAITFGDGVGGRMPRPGEALRALAYRYGGGVAGNVPAEGINKISRIRTSPQKSKLKVSNLFAARFGRDAETEQEAKRRVPRVLRHRERAVAAEDFTDLALTTPGVHVGRAEVLPRHKPHERVDEVPGVVTLVVLPASDPLHPDEPTPDKEMLRRVCEHLEPRRLVTTELYVTPPEYVDFWVSVAVDVEAGFGIDTVNGYVELAIRQQFAPLPPYGPGGTGWPFGRAVTPAEVEAAVLRVEGVRLVNGDVAVHHRPVGGEDAGRRISTVAALEAWQLPVLRNVQVGNESAPADIDENGDSARPPADTAAIPVPVEREEC